MPRDSKSSDDLLSLGMAGLHPLEVGAMDIFALKRRIGEQVALVGNVDMGLLAAGDPPDVERAVGELADRLSAGGGYLLSSGNSISADVQPRNVVAMGRALTNWNQRHWPTTSHLIHRENRPL